MATEFGPHNMTSNSAPSPFVASASTEFSGSFQAYEAFDGTGNSNRWSAIGATGWLKLDVGSGNAKICTSYKLQASAAGASTDTPKNWTLEGSNDNSTWTTVDTQTNQTGWSANEVRTFTPGTVTTAYRYFRINISADNGGTNTSIGELSLFTENIGVNVTKLVGYAVLSPFDGVDVTKLVGYAVLGAANNFPVPYGSALGCGTVGIAYSETIAAQGGTPPYTYALVGSLPPGLSLNTSTGVISGTPTTAGTYTFIITVTDSLGTLGSTAFSITISNAATVTVVPYGPALGDGFVGIAYSETLAAGGGTGPYTFAVTSGSLPAGLALASGGGITGTPTTVGVYSFTVTATDAASHTGAQAFQITIDGSGGGVFTFSGG